MQIHDYIYYVRCHTREILMLYGNCHYSYSRNENREDFDIDIVDEHGTRKSGEWYVISDGDVVPEEHQEAFQFLTAEFEKADWETIRITSILKYGK